MKVIINILVNSIAVLISAYILPGVQVNGFLTAILVAIAFALINMIVKPILFILTFPITLITLGLFSFVINALMVLLVSFIVRGFHVNGFLWALLFSIVLSIVSALLHFFVK